MQKVLGIALVATIAFTTTTESFAQDLEIQTRFIRIHPDGPNNQINNAIEAAGILDGTVLDVVINDDILGTVLTADFGGGNGSFSNDQFPWGNGDESTGMNDFIQQITGVWTIPEGDWTVGFGSDDGGILRFSNSAITFIETFNENGPLVVDGDGELLANAPRGHDWTIGTITIPAGGLKTGIEAFMHERGGGDSFEIAYIEGHYDPDSDGGRNEFIADGFELDNGEFGDWQLEDEPFSLGASNDLNGDGNVDNDDFNFLAENWGGSLNFETLHALASELNVPAGASSVPEPASVTMLLSALAFLLGVRRRRC